MCNYMYALEIKFQKMYNLANFRHSLKLEGHPRSSYYV